MCQRVDAAAPLQPVVEVLQDSAEHRPGQIHTGTRLKIGTRDPVVLCKENLVAPMLQQFLTFLSNWKCHLEWGHDWGEFICLMQPAKCPVHKSNTNFRIVSM